ncbi:hypothetical protein PYCC9005_003988 [Savitreella phatthalungensis]
MSLTDSTGHRPEIVLYAYDFAPNCQKVIRFLKLFRIPHKYVKVPPIQPRPDYAAVDITYRRSPLLSIDADLYVDTSLIIEKLLDIAGHLKLYAGDCTNHIAFDALGAQMFPYCGKLIPRSHPNMNDSHFVRDRQLIHGGAKEAFDPDTIAKGRPDSLQQFDSWLHRIEKDMLAGKQYFLGGDLPSTADFYVWYLIDWILVDMGNSRLDLTPEKYPVISQWCKRIHDLMDESVVQNYTWEDAKKTLLSPRSREYVKFVEHDQDNYLGLSPGARVSVTPKDNGKEPQDGELITLGKRQLCIRNKSGIAMHFPVINYDIVQIDQ